MFVYYINVPLNEEGVYEFEQYDEIMKNVRTFELSEEEYEYLRMPKGLFEIYDVKFGTFIDVCEEERIEKAGLHEALEYAKQMYTETKVEVGKSALCKVIESITCAIRAETFWEIDIYLE